MQKSPAQLHTMTDKTPVEASVKRRRQTLSLRPGSVSRPHAASGLESRVDADRMSAGSAADAVFGTQNSVVPLTHLTAGRKEIKIAHDGATYLLRITKSNKLILTKTEAKQAASTS